VTRDPAVEPTGGDETGAGGSEAAMPSYGPPSYGSAGYGPVAGYGHPGYAVPRYGQPGYPMPGHGAGYGQPGMRAAAADRERTIDVLKAAYGEGRLTQDEFEDRAARAMSAKTYGELGAIVADLPAGPGGPAMGGYYPPPSALPPTNGVAVGSLVFSVVGLFMPLMLIPGLIMGHMARDQIRVNQQRGDGFAVAGLVFGYLGVALWVLIIAVVAAHH
jgi:Domain of unknown function (DUF1707)/Domain of unknown function (DUF4190)